MNEYAAVSWMMVYRLLRYAVTVIVGTFLAQILAERYYALTVIFR